MPWKEKICEVCMQQFDVYIKKSDPIGRRTCKSDCASILRGRTFSKIFSGAGNPAFGKTYRTKETHPEWAQKTSDTHKERGTLVGDKNPMKNKNVAARMSKTRRERVTSNPEYKAARSKWGREAWARGDYDGVRVGQCKWHDFMMSTGLTVKCQGLWELEYAKYLDGKGIQFLMHVDRISYIDDNGIQRTYYPDFKLEDGSYIDVKNPYYEKIHAHKIELVTKQNPHIRLEIMGAEKLRALGLKLSGYNR